jgi:mono/diheme cytochrome c family protein
MYHGNKSGFGREQLASMEEIKQTKSYIRDPDPVKDVISEGDLHSGRILYNTYCAACHQGDGKGDNNRFPPLRDSKWVMGDEHKLIDVVLNGIQGRIEVNGKSYDGLMPANSHLDDHAIASILTYVRKAFGNESPPVSALVVEKVRKETTAKK